MLLYPDNVKILKCKIFLINFLDELGNFKQKIFTLQNVKFFTFQSNRPLDWNYHEARSPFTIIETMKDGLKDEIH